MALPHFSGVELPAKINEVDEWVDACDARAELRAIRDRLTRYGAFHAESTLSPVSVSPFYLPGECFPAGERAELARIKEADSGADDLDDVLEDWLTVQIAAARAGTTPPTIEAYARKNAFVSKRCNIKGVRRRFVEPRSFALWCIGRFLDEGKR